MSITMDRKKIERKLSIVEELEGIDKFFQDLATPANLPAIREEAVAFCEKHRSERCIVLVTVSATKLLINVEKNTICF